jgi:hypothetical protein
MEGLAVEVFHDEVGEAGVVDGSDAEVGEVDDVGVAEAAGGFCFALKANEEFAIAHEVGGDDLDGDGAFGAGVNGLVDAAHATLAEQLFDQVFVIESTSNKRVHEKLGGKSNETSTPRCSTYRSGSRTGSRGKGGARRIFGADAGGEGVPAV